MSTVAQETGSITAPNGKLRRAESTEERWSRMPVIVDGGDYLASLRDRGTELYLLGERIEEPADHPIIKTSINSLRMTYALAISAPEVSTGHPPPIASVINRFLPVGEGPHELVAKHYLQRRCAPPTGTRF